jgi:hypothetical protein
MSTQYGINYQQFISSKIPMSWFPAFSMGMSAGQLVSLGAPAAGAAALFRSAYHNRGDGLPKALSTAYRASRGVIRGVHELSGWVMDVASNMYPNDVRYRNLGFAVGLTMPLMNLLPIYVGINKWRSGNRLKGALSLAFGLGMIGYDIHSTMKLMRNVLETGAAMNFRTAGATSHPPGDNASEE